MTEREKLQEELIEELDHYYLSKTIPTLDELAKVEELKSQLAELKEESIAKTETDTGHLIDMPELEKPSGAEEIRDKLSKMCFCKSPHLCSRCKEEQTVCNNEEIRKDIFKYLTTLGEHRQQGMPTEEEISIEAYDEDMPMEGDQHTFKYAFDDDQAEAFISGAKWAVNKWKGE